jgi:hypothetical protein
MSEMCHCGRPLHYSNPQTERVVREMVELHGEFLIVETSAGRWSVPRHYIALHGLKAAEVPALGFARADN